MTRTRFISTVGNNFFPREGTGRILRMEIKKEKNVREVKSLRLRRL